MTNSSEQIILLIDTAVTIAVEKLHLSLLNNVLAVDVVVVLHLLLLELTLINHYLVQVFSRRSANSMQILRTVLMHFLPDLLKLSFILIPHIVCLLDALFSYPTYLTAQDLAKLIHSDATQ